MIGGEMMDHSTVADLTIDEFKHLVKEIVAQTLAEVFSDPDEGLELRDDFRRELESSYAAMKAGSKTIPAQEVATRLGLSW